MRRYAERDVILLANYSTWSPLPKMIECTGALDRGLAAEPTHILASAPRLLYVGSGLSK
jgi:hypothetical protein